MHLGLCAALFLAGCPLRSGSESSTSVAGITVQGIQTGTAACKTPPNIDVLVARVLELVNHEREQRGLHALTLNPVLSKIADDYCCEMIEGGFFDHTNPFT